MTQRGRNTSASQRATLASALSFVALCLHFLQAKAALDDAEIAYEEIDLGQYPKLLAEVKATTGRVTVPQVRT